MKNEIQFKNLQLELPETVETIEFDECVIEIQQYLPAALKHMLITQALRSSLSKGIYIPHLVDIHFHMYIVIMYSNINFSDEDLEDFLHLFDVCVVSGLLDKVLSKIPAKEYEELTKNLVEYEKKLTQYSSSMPGFAKELASSFEENIEKVKGFLNSNELESLMETLRSSSLVEDSKEALSAFKDKVA